MRAVYRFALRAAPLIRARASYAIPAILKLVEKVGQLRMPQRFAAVVRQQILFGNVGDILRIVVFC